MGVTKKHLYGVFFYVSLIIRELCLELYNFTLDFFQFLGAKLLT